MYIGPSINFVFKYFFMDTYWTHIRHVSDMYPYLVCIWRVSELQQAYLCSLDAPF
jgi:hypothetical protein